jgi:hypothetical protein
LVERWDGTTWRTVASPNPDPGGLSELNGVAAVPAAPGTVWAVGSHSTPNANFGTRKLILRRTGGVWQVLGSPTFTPEDHLEAVDASGPADAWAVGWGSTSPFGGTAVGIALRWNGSSWRSVPIPQPSPVMLFGVAALAPDDVWAVGHTYLGGPHWVPLILHWNGTSWSRATIPAFPAGGQLRDVVALSPTNVYAVGLDGEGFSARSLVLRWNGSSWTREGTPSPPGGPKLYGAAAIGPSTVDAVCIPAGIEPATPSLPSMRGRFTKLCSASRDYTTAQVRGAAEGWVVSRREATPSTASGKSLAQRHARRPDPTSAMQLAAAQSLPPFWLPSAAGQGARSGGVRHGRTSGRHLRGRNRHATVTARSSPVLAG